MPVARLRDPELENEVVLPIQLFELLAPCNARVQS
jgi:hypothetical protein